MVKYPQNIAEAVKILDKYDKKWAETVHVNELEWKILLDKTDRGSYCEEAGYDFKLTNPVHKAYQTLVNVLLEYQRANIH